MLGLGNELDVFRVEFLLDGDEGEALVETETHLADETVAGIVLVHRVETEFAFRGGQGTGQVVLRRRTTSLTGLSKAKTSKPL